jgi:hypothetical protein
MAQDAGAKPKLSGKLMQLKARAALRSIRHRVGACAFCTASVADASCARQFMQRAVEKDRPIEPAPVQARAERALAQPRAAKRSRRAVTALLRR